MAGAFLLREMARAVDFPGAVRLGSDQRGAVDFADPVRLGVGIVSGGNEHYRRTKCGCAGRRH